MKLLIEMPMGVFLDLEPLFPKEREIPDERSRLLEINQDTDTATLGWIKDRGEQAGCIKGRELALPWVLQNALLKVGWQ